MGTGGISLENDLCDTLRANTKGHEQIVLFDIDSLTPPPDRVYQNTGHGWWTESNVCETLRTPCGGDSMKANLIVEVLEK